MSRLASLAFAPFAQAGSMLISDQLAEITGVGSAGYRRDIGIRQNKAQPNVLAPVDAMIANYWRSAFVNGEPSTDALRQLDRELAQHGIDSSNGLWRNIINGAGNRANLDAYLRGYYRRISAAGPDGPVDIDWQAEITRRIRREQLLRPVDQELTLRAPFAWSAADALRLLWMGVIQFDQYLQIVAASGAARPDDALWARLLAQYLPDPETLTEWAQRRLWDDALAERYQLDQAYQSSPIATFFSRAQGVGDGRQIDLPRQPEGTTDWLKLQMRAGAPLPGFAEARVLQHRLRDDGSGTGQSVVPGVPTWTAQNTRDMLIVAGYTQPVQDRLMGLVYEPINVRIINEVLLEALKHPAVAAAADAAFGAGTDWVAGAYLDHGFAPPVAMLAANGLRARANDEYYAERDTSARELRASGRALALAQYEAGTLATDAAITALTGEQYTASMAVEALTQIDGKVQLALTEAVVASVKEAYLSGKITIAQAGSQLTTAGILPARQIIYYQEWTWQRGDRVRMLSTAEILGAIKSRLMTPEDATARLTNLGWTAPDAAIEIAAVEQEIAQAAARASASALARQTAEAQRAAREAAAAQAKLAREQAAAARAAKKAADQAQAAPIDAAADAAKYDASALLDLDAYNKAVAKGDTTKADAEIAKAVAAYRELLAEQLAIKQEGPDEARAVGPVSEISVPGVAPGAGAGADTAGAASQPGAATAKNEGSDQPPAT